MPRYDDSWLAELRQTWSAAIARGQPCAAELPLFTPLKPLAFEHFCAESRRFQPRFAEPVPPPLAAPPYG